MTPADLLATFRSEMSDASAPYLWPDAEFFKYLDDAQKMFCRLTDGLADASTPAVVDIAVPVAADWVNLHPAILKIRAARRVSDGAPITVINYEDMERLGLRFDGITTGPIARLIEGMEENKARVSPVASVVDAIKLMVFRLPLVAITAADSVLEVSEQHHLHLLPWTKRHAYLKQDAQTLDKTKASEFEATFRDYCAAAKIEQQKKRHKVRTVAYGGL